MKVGVFTNLHKDTDLSVTKKLLEKLEANGISYALESGLSSRLNGQFFTLENNEKFDFMFTVGGDGTILRVAKYCAINDIPIVGINLGYTGFLAEAEPSQIDVFIDAIKSGKFRVDERSFLRAETDGKSFLALNDAVINRQFDAKMLETDVYVSGAFVDRFFCDGYIISTPTGSTAYSLSAGGAILAPTVSAFILTSINSHSLHSRPIVVSESDEIKLVISDRSSANLVVDGVVACALGVGQTVVVKKAKESVKFVRINEKSFYNKLLTKLNKWSVTEKESE